VSRIDHYVLEGELARGGMGVVYRGRDEQTGRPVAVKLLLSRRSSDDKANRRFLREGRALAKLRHSNVVAIHACGQSERGPYLVLDLVQGVSLEERLHAGGVFGPEEAAEIGAKLADALQHAHQAGVIHRDVKPANVLLDERGQPQLTDFGLARDQDPDVDTERLSRTGVFMGTPGYWPPEQARGDLERVGPRSDVFSLGATIYELVAGESPFAAATLAQAMARLRQPVRPLRELRPDAPAGLEAILLRCLELDPAERYPSAMALAADLRAYLAGQRPRALVQRGRARSWRPALGLVLLGALLAGLLVVWRGRSGGPAAATPAPRERSRRAAPSPPAVEDVRRLLAAGDRPAASLEAAVDLLALGDDVALALDLVTEAALRAWAPRPSSLEPLRRALERIDRLPVGKREAAGRLQAVVWVAVGEFARASRRLEEGDAALRDALRLLDSWELRGDQTGSEAVSRWEPTVPSLELAQAAEPLVARDDPLAWITVQQLVHRVASVGLIQHLDLRGMQHAWRLQPPGPARTELILAMHGPAAYTGRTHAGGGDYENVFLERDPAEVMPEVFQEPRMGADFLLAVRVYEAVHDPQGSAQRYLEEREALVAESSHWTIPNQLRFDAAVLSALILETWRNASAGDSLGRAASIAARWESPTAEQLSDAWVQVALLAATANVMRGEDATPWAERLTAHGSANEGELVLAEQELVRGEHEAARARLEATAWIHPLAQRALLHAHALTGGRLRENAFARVESLREEHRAMFPWHADDAEAVVAGLRRWPGLSERR
jgi:hypothetical protein